MKAKALKFASCVGYELGIFAMLCIQAMLNYSTIANMAKDYYSYYLVDFSMGRTSRLLIGSIVNLLTDNPTEQWIETFALTVLIITLFVTALILGRVIKCTKKEIRNILYVFILFFATGSFGMYGFSHYFGMLDIYMFIFALLAVCCLFNKYLCWLAPLFCVAGIFVNYGFAFSYFPLVIAAALYFAAEEKRKVPNTINLLLTGSASVAATAFCYLKVRDMMLVSFDELWKIIEQKSGITFEYSEIKYYDFYFYGNTVRPDTGEAVTDLPLKDMITEQLKLMLNPNGNMLDVGRKISVYSISLLFFAMFIAIWIMCIKNTSKKSQKFVYLCFALTQLFVAFSCIISTDTGRWVQAGGLVQFGLAFLMFYKKDEAFEKTVWRLKEFFKGEKSTILIAFFLVYSTSLHT